MARQIVAWAPNPGSQEDFCKAREFEVFIGGGRGGGKTDALIAIMLKYAQYPLYNGLLLRRNLNDMLEIRDRCMRLFKKLDPGCIWSKDDSRFILSSGATIELGHCNKEEDKFKYYGKEYQIVGFDEVPQFTNTQYEEIKLSCRSKDPRMKPIVRSTGNPGGISHSYFRDRFMKGLPGTVITEELVLPDGTKTILDRKWIKSTVYDNPILIKNDPQYIAILLSTPDTRLRKMMLEGDWDAAEGLFFSAFNRLVHIRKLEDVFPGGLPPRGMRVFCSMDWGYATPFAIYWHAIDNMDRIITFREHYGIAIDPVRNTILQNVGVRRVASTVIEDFLTMNIDLAGRVEALVLDPSTKQTHGLSSFSIFHEIALQLQDYVTVIPGSNDRPSGWNQVRARLEVDPGTMTPWWTITENCVHMIRTLSGLPEDPTNNYEPPKKSEDHCFAAGTPVFTDKGVVPIEEVDADVHSVWSMGKWRRLKRSGLTREMTPVVKVTFSDGSAFVCTPDHRFLDCTDTWRYAKELLGKEFLCELPLSAIRSKSSWGWSIINVLITSSAKVLGCTKRYGRRITGRFRKDTISTIKMITAAIMPLRTSNVLLKTTTSAGNTGMFLRKTDDAMSTMQSLPHQHGTGVQKVEHGMRNMHIAALFQPWRSRLTKFVSIVAHHIRALPSISISANGVATTVKHVHCVSVEDWGCEPVYCVNEPETAAFTLSGGFLVHNSADAARYAMMYVPLPLEQLQRRIAETKLAEWEAQEAEDNDPLSGYRDGIESFRRKQASTSDRLIDSYITR